MTPADTVGLEPIQEWAHELIDAELRIIGAIERSARPTHPLDRGIGGCRHVVFHAPGACGADTRSATSLYPGWLDRSPCGTGTSARVAQLHARGELILEHRFVDESTRCVVC